MTLVSLSIPCYGGWHQDFALDVIRLIGSLPPDGGVSVEINYLSSSILPQARQGLAEKALNSNADYVLFLDSDMRFPADALIKLLLREKPIIGANYTQRKPPHTGTASKDDKRVRSLGRSGIQEVDAMGFGVCLIATEVFRSLDPPWFMFGWDKQKHQFIGEDVFFFHRARKAGFPVFIDHDLSQQVRHIGEVELDVDMSAIG